MHQSGSSVHGIGIDGPRDPRMFTNTRPRSSFLLLGALCAGLLLLRQPGSLLHPQFWAEDGTLFFQQAFNEGFLSTILRPASGYLHSLPRLVAGLSLLLPLELAPLVFNLASFTVQLLPALYLLSGRMSPLIPSLPARILAALLYIVLPASYETHVNLTNTHWYLTLTALCILVARPPTTGRVKVLETLAVALFSLTGPFSVLFLPLVARRLAGSRCAPRSLGRLQALIIASGALIQVGFALTSARVSHAVAPYGHLSARELLTVVSMHSFFNALFGINGFTRVYGQLHPAVYGLGLLALGYLLFVALRDRIGPLLILFYLAAASIALSFAFPLNDPRIWHHPQAGPRYFLFAAIFVHLSLLHLAFAARSGRSIGKVLLVFAAIAGIPADYFHPRQPDTHWADNAAVFRSLPAGSDFTIPVVPLYHAGMVLHKRTTARGPSPLSRLRSIASTTPSAAAVRRPQRVVLNAPTNESLLEIAGWALDGPARTPAGGVYVLLDDRLFPAVCGLPAAIDADGRACENCGFSRLLPIAEIGPGTHRLSIVVITGDRQGYYRPLQLQPFDVSQFFP